jgi:hypothetical protein
MPQYLLKDFPSVDIHQKVFQENVEKFDPDLIPEAGMV